MLELATVAHDPSPWVDWVDSLAPMLEPASVAHDEYYDHLMIRMMMMMMLLMMMTLMMLMMALCLHTLTTKKSVVTTREDPTWMCPP